MPPLPESAVPILPSCDLGRSEAFYTYLGFRVLGRARDYLRVAHGAIELHLYLADELDPVHNPAGCYFRVADPEALRRTWRRDGVSCLEVPGSTDYGQTRFALVDPDGNILRYGPAEPALL
ncbi:MAG TPA: VOC family protein [Actinocrinis sp.]|nr:VOC family protein [Actinocrinis sp.]